MGDDRKRIDPRIEHAKPARLPDPRLTRMPHAHILAPDDRHLLNSALGQPGAGRGDPRREPAVPGGEQGRIDLVGLRFKRLDLRQRRAGGLFQKDVDALGQGLRRQIIADLRRRAERHRVDRRTFGQQRIEAGQMRHPRQPGIMRADGRGQAEGIIAPDRRHMLVARDLADADDRDTDRVHRFRAP